MIAMRKPNPIELTPVTAKEAKQLLSGKDVGVAKTDRDMIEKAEPSDKIIGYVAVNPYNEQDKWFIAKEFADNNYVLQEAFSFSVALEHLKAGRRVARKGWNGKGMFIFLVPGSTFKVNRPPLLGIYPEGTEVRYHSHIDMRTADGQIVPWLASQTDMLEDDWVLVEDNK